MSPYDIRYLAGAEAVGMLSVLLSEKNLLSPSVAQIAADIVEKWEHAFDRTVAEPEQAFR